MTDQINSATGCFNTSFTVGEDGPLISENKYTAFGEVRSLNGVLVTDNRYTGQREEAEIGLYYYVARWYDPVLAHFTQADTVVPNHWVCYRMIGMLMYTSIQFVYRIQQDTEVGEKKG